jgi:hypothetical protein
LIASGWDVAAWACQMNRSGQHVVWGLGNGLQTNSRPPASFSLIVRRSSSWTGHPRIFGGEFSLAIVIDEVGECLSARSCDRLQRCRFIIEDLLINGTAGREVALYPCHASL